jgi:hypothetical protein
MSRMRILNAVEQEQFESSPAFNSSSGNSILISPQSC